MEGQGAGPNAGAPAAATPQAGAPPPADPVAAAAEAAKAAAGAPGAGAASGEAGVSPAPGAAPGPGDSARESAALRHVQQRERELLRQKQEIAARERTIATTVEQQVREGVAKELARFKEDPIGALRTLGYDDQTIANRLLHQGKKTPDEVANEALAEAKRVREDNEKARRTEAARQASENFAAEATNAEKYPHLNDMWTRSEAISEAHRVVDQLRAKGVDPNQFTLADIAKHLDKVAKAKFERIEKSKAERAKKATPQGETKAEGNGSPGQGGTPGKTATTTTLGKNLGGRESLNGKAGHLLTDAELAAAVDAEVAPIRASLRSAS